MFRGHESGTDESGQGGFERWMVKGRATYLLLLISMICLLMLVSERLIKVDEWYDDCG